MNRTFDVVIAGGGHRAVAAARRAARNGSRVLMVCRQSSAAVERLIGHVKARTVEVMGDAEVVCVDGVGAPEAVVVRESKTGRLIGVNTSELLWLTSPRAARPRLPAWRSVDSPRRRRALRTPGPAEL
jgi:thioredoxin reductase